MNQNRRIFFNVLSGLLCCFILFFARGARPAFAAYESAVGSGEEDAQALQESANYNYYLGEYYYTQGRFNAAEPYFRRSRDLIEKKNEIVSERREKPTFKGRAGGGKLEYKIGEGDTLHIAVWQNDDLAQDVIVRPDGMISFPLVGDVQAEGLTLSMLREELTNGLKEFIRMPEVSISVKRLGASKVILLGQVVYPGVYAVSGKRTVLEAIALAGGFTNDAVASSVILVRGGLDNPKAQRLSMNRPLSGKDTAKNDVALESEDIIFVPKKFVSDVNYVINQILGPMLQGSFNSETMRKAKW